MMTILINHVIKEVLKIYGLVEIRLRRWYNKTGHKDVIHLRQ